MHVFTGRVKIVFLSPAREHTVKPVLRGHLKIDQIKVFMDNGSLMEVESIAECSKGSILQYFWPAICDNWYWKTIFGVIFEWPLKTGFTVVNGLLTPCCSYLFLIRDSEFLFHKLILTKPVRSIDTTPRTWRSTTKPLARWNFSWWSCSRKLACRWKK